MYTNEGMESPVSDDAFEGNPIAERYQTAFEQGKWVDELAASRKELGNFHETGKKIIKRYSDERDAEEKGSSYLNIFFANTEIKMAALYARTPKPDIHRRFDDPDDDVARVAGAILERNISYELECDGFDQTFKQVLFDRLVPGMGIGWTRLEQEAKEPEIDPMTGQPVPGSDIGNQNACIDHVAWDDFFYAPCRVWTECRWVARRVPMDKQAIKERFGTTAPAEILASLNFAQKKDEKNNLGPKNSVDKTVDVYEIWDKTRRLVFWIAESAEVPLDVQEDTNDFPDFFPTPLPPLGRFNNSKTVAIPDYKLCQDQYRELDDLNNRCSKLTQALQLRWVYDAANPELAELYQTGQELQGLPVKNWAAFQSDKGGLRGALEFAPLDEIASTYQKLSMARDVVKNQIYEVEGISDILRGAATPYETATATNAKAGYSASRINIMQRDVAEYIQRLLRLKAHLICRFYKAETIMSRAGMPAAADQQMVPDALALLKNEQMRHFRLEVAADSLQLPDWEQDKREKNELINALTGFLGQLLPAVQQTPQLAPLGLSIMKFGVSGFKGSKNIEGVIDAGLQQIVAAKQQTESQPKPPSPDEIKAQLTQMKLQADMQMEQMRQQTQREIAAMQAQMDAQRIQLDQAELALKAQQSADQHQREIARLHIDAVDKAHQVATSVTPFPTE